MMKKGQRALVGAKQGEYQELVQKSYQGYKGSPLASFELIIQKCDREEMNLELLHFRFKRVITIGSTEESDLHTIALLFEKKQI